MVAGAADKCDYVCCKFCYSVHSIFTGAEDKPGEGVEV
jgi:hypothetical protein